MWKGRTIFQNFNFSGLVEYFNLLLISKHLNMDLLFGNLLLQQGTWILSIYLLTYQIKIVFKTNKNISLLKHYHNVLHVRKFDNITIWQYNNK